MAEETRQVCPRCCQDYLVRARVRPFEDVLYLCPECDAFWRSLEDAKKLGAPTYGSGFQTLDDYMEGLGLADRNPWDYLEFLE